jgi:hypothetical protein
MKTATRQTASTLPSTKTPKRIVPSRVSADAAAPFTMTQKLETFGTWTSDSIWVPPKDFSNDFARDMVNRFGCMASKAECWGGILDEHRALFQQVREINLCKASIRLPKGKLFVSITEQDRFDEITDPIPNCVKTRLEEFLEGPGKLKGVKVYYLKPLCVEVGDDLIFTTRESIDAAICMIQRQVFNEYRRLYLRHRPLHALSAAVDLGLSIPRKIWLDIKKQRQKALDAYQAQLEFKRRKIALRAANTHRRLRTDGCTFDDMLALTNPLERNDVIEQYGIERKLSQAQRDQLKMLAVESIPWFVAFSLGVSYLVPMGFSLATALTVAPPLMVCDPAFVAEMPGSKGVVLKIGHFDQVRGVTHVEI